jgi:tRNA A-37 threonylcarbamoyl transferase component Bud32/uncharacterized RDD family membrane protein YckC
MIDATVETKTAPHLKSGTDVDDPLQMVRQARKIRPAAGLVTVAEFTDIGVISLLGALVFGLSTGIIAYMLPGGHEHLSAIVGLGFSVGWLGFFIFMLSAIIPIFFPVALIVLQIISGVATGTIVFDVLCSWFGIAPSTVPVLAQFSAIFLTIIYSVLPIFLCPLYFAFSLSSRWQTSVGWSLVGLMVCDQNGRRASFGQAFKRTILRLWWPIMFPSRLTNSNYIDDWVEERTKTVLVLKPRNLRAALIRARDQVHKTKDRILIVAHSSLTNMRVRQQQNVSHNASSVISAEAMKQLLKIDWQSIILRVEIYILIMLSLLFAARCNVAYWQQVYFNGFKAGSALNFLDVLAHDHPVLNQAIPILSIAVYLVFFFLARRSIPQILQMTAKGFTVSSKARSAGLTWNKWEDVDNVYLEDKVGKDEDEKWLVFSMRNKQPVKVRLDIIRSMNSKEEILQAIEKWAPQASRQAELVSFLQPPSDFSYTDIWMEALSAPPKRDKLKPLVPGAVLKDGQYRVQRLLAVGGQGSVYLANDSVVSEDIVLKEFVLPVYVDLSIRRKTIERFEKEARLLKQLDHHKVVKLLDFFVEDHRAYLVLEHLDGKNLRDLVKDSGRRSEKETMSLALQMCEILRYLHNQDPVIIHRDFTPDNLILGNDGQLRLIDFNVAQSLDNAATTTGTVVGKPSYLAPEQFQGEPTAQSDLYSMGASLYYLLTATDPLPIAQSHPAKVVPTIGEELDNLVATCTEYNVALRYQSVEELEQALRALNDSHNI